MKTTKLARFVMLAMAVMATTFDTTVFAQAKSPKLGSTTTPIQHFIVLMEENRSFDSYFGTYAGNDELSQITCVKVGAEATNCRKPVELKGKPMTLLSKSASQYSGFSTLGYYTDMELPYLWNVADHYVLFNRYFSSAPSTAKVFRMNKLYAISGTAGVSQTANISGEMQSTGYANAPTIFDRLQASGISWKFYVQGYDPKANFRTYQPGTGLPSQVARVPLLSIPRFVNNPKLAANIVDLSEYYNDLQHDTLPAVAYIVAAGASEPTPGSVLISQRHLKNVMQALMRSNAWSTSALLWTHDQSGGWYDHVQPPKINTDSRSNGYGLRVPAMLISPYAHAGKIDDTVLEHSSILKFIEHNWNLKPLGPRDTSANTFLSAFNFEQPPRAAEFLPMMRQSVGQKNAGQQSTGSSVIREPIREWIFVLYGIALAAAILVLVPMFIVRLLRSNATHRTSIPASISVEEVP